MAAKRERDLRSLARRMGGLRSDKPVVLADAQDNAGGGANSDTTGLLRALIEARAEGAVLANL